MLEYDSESHERCDVFEELFGKVRDRNVQHACCVACCPSDQLEPVWDQYSCLHEVRSFSLS